MAGLPSGNVTLLFSDIEGSTLLLSRLGESYAEALDQHRQVLRDAWSTYGGAELGTEGDSFFVAFPTADGAVLAAAQAQRGLVATQWPAGEQLKVRMGIHTGVPTPRHGGYVGMDVHRAARIAGAAHGGQVLISQATAHLVETRLPVSIGLRDLGKHRLKDIAGDERLFQLTIEGLRSDFGTLKTLGASASLPRFATRLVGRGPELVELTALVSKPHVRLVTLTGPGGAGKTRLAVSLAAGLADAFPDGVYFVPLAMATTAESMWTSIAEVMDIPAQGRALPDFFTHVAHRSALFVLDNLEQLSSADDVVARLLDEAPDVVVVATSRRPLHVDGEYEHPVPPLSLPENADRINEDALRTSGAVRMFVEQARMVRHDFALTPDNVADVLAICSRVDGLPLAIELVAARTKMLSPRALLDRLGRALDMASDNRQRPRRQRTLREAINWSHDLLAPDQQVFFRRLGVFAGSADMNALASVAGEQDGGIDVFEQVAGLADASLVTVIEDDLGEPRLELLETIRTFALDTLREAGEFDEIGRAHAQHYLSIVERLHAEYETGLGDQVLEAGRRFAIEHDNVRAALGWALAPPSDEDALSNRTSIGLQLCAEAGRLWSHVGYLAEGRQWLERAISIGGPDSPELAQCLCWLAGVRILTGDLESSDDAASEALGVSRRIDYKHGIVWALRFQGFVAYRRGDLSAARRIIEEEMKVSRDVGDEVSHAESLTDLARVELAAGRFEHALTLLEQAVEIDNHRGSEYDAICHRVLMSPALRSTGQVHKAHELLLGLVPQMLRLGHPAMVAALAEELSVVLAELGHHREAIRLAAATTALRAQSETMPAPQHHAEIEKFLQETRTVLDQESWAQCYESGFKTPVEDVLHALVSDN